MSPPSSGSKDKPSKFCLPPAFTPVSCLVYSWTLKMKMRFSSETPVNFQRTARRNVPELLKLKYVVTCEWRADEKAC
jgi:hypothetical protein